MLMELELSRIQKIASEARLAIRAVALKCIKRKAKSERDDALSLRLFFKHLN